jgi:hypothetical protein
MSKTQKFKPDNAIAHDKTPVQVKVQPGVREKLKAVPNWQERLREFIDLMVAESK